MTENPLDAKPIPCRRCDGAVESAQPRACAGCGAPYHKGCFDDSGCAKEGCEGYRGASPVPAPVPLTRFQLAVRVALFLSVPLVLLGELKGLTPEAVTQLGGMVAGPILALVIVQLVLTLPRYVFTRRIFRNGAKLLASLYVLVLSLHALGYRLAVRELVLAPLGLAWEPAASCLVLATAVFGLIAYDAEGGRFGAGVTLLGMILVLSGIAIPNFRAARERANTRACFANQKTIIGAVEMFQLDKNTKVPQLLPYVKQLKQGGYLRSTPQDPGQGPNTAHHYELVADSANGIHCTVHGAIIPRR